ncbi:phage terminase large subunit [Anaplasmataceae bacterium AB001_6]|nr:phage terminase large subunit [Anaplasmataceae bacterium AB001_6]
MPHKNNYDFKIFVLKCFKELFPNTQFHESWHLDLILDHIEAVENFKIKRSIINMPPRSMKSFFFSIVFPAWLMGNDPSLNIIVASYSYGLSIKHSLDTRYIMSSAWYKEMFPDTIISCDQNTKIKFKTSQHGFRLAASTGSYLIGEGADVIIADDPITPMQVNSENTREKNIEWFESSLMTRLNNFKNGRVVVVMHRLHDEDLTGYLIKKDNFHWNKLIIPFLVEEKDKIYKSVNDDSLLCSLKEGDVMNPNLYCKRDVLDIKKELSTHVFNTQYQQNPNRNNKSIIKYEWFKKFKEYPDLPYKVVYSCDTSVSENGDYSVFIKIHIKNELFYIIDIIREKCDYVRLKRIAQDVFSNSQVDKIIIENKSSGEILIQELSKIINTPIIKINPSISKLHRVEKALGVLESGRVLLPEKSSWLYEFEKELCDFPNGKYDDQVDALSQFINWYKGNSESYIRSL